MQQAMAEPGDLHTLAAAPVDEPHRITALDSLRGFALLGILLMNIVVMGLYAPAYDDPTVTGGATGANLWVWISMHVLAEGKMRCVFSMVFGASVVLLTSRLQGRADAADIYYRRTLWLLLFGVVHAYLWWVGDILYPYALCGLVLYPFRNLDGRRLLIIGGCVLLVNSLIHLGHGFTEREMVMRGVAAEELARQGKKLTGEQQSAKDEYERSRKMSHPDAEALRKDTEEWRSRNPIRVIQTRAGGVLYFHSKLFYGPLYLDIWCMMFIGMGLLKIGFLRGSSPLRVYVATVVVGYGIGIPLNSWTAWLIVRSHFDPGVRALTGLAYDVGRLTVALGHVGVILLLANTGTLRFVTRTLGAVGQMAFSNYIFQSVVTAFLFTGYGFALYGRLERHQLYYVVAAIWAIQLIASPLWLRHYRFGPLEWCWRSLTYWKKQPMRRDEPALTVP